MAKDRDMVRKTTTVERLPAREGDPVAGQLRAGMKEFARLTMGGYADQYWATMEDTSARLDVFKRMGGQFMKKGELEYAQMEGSEVEGYVIASWGPGTYQLRPMIGSKYYGPVSVPYKIGDQGDDDKATTARGDGVEELVGKLAIAKQLKELKDGLLTGETRREDDGMKAADVQVMLNTALQPLQTMLASSERRAEVAEQRSHELQMKLMEMANGRQQTAQSSIGELIKLLPKEALGALLAPADTPGWAEKAVDALREFGPVIAQTVLEYFRPGVAAAVAASGQPALPAPNGPQPTETAQPGGGGRAMPIPLNPEQMEAKNLLVECIKGRDFANAYAMIENFPGFTPTAQGPMPIGGAFLSLVDPKVTKPRIYVIQMMQLVPEVKDFLPLADEFIGYVQQRLMKDQEAYLAQQAARQSGTSGPRPTPTEDERS